ncbi:MAG: SDR family oxidoreductase [Deltaproteobacteria bacterium]|nr:SDR family oxidoreductase [Deltaproteobacteria bacterium]
MKLTPESRVYIAGAGGMLGDAVIDHFAPRCRVKATDIDLRDPRVELADVRDAAAIARSIEDFRPDLVINLAAITDLEECEREAENAWLTNALGAENTGLVARRLDVPYVYVSTAGIFDGKKEVYTDFDEPNPLGVYAKSKLAGEVWVKTSVPRHFVVRAGWMMGGGPNKDKKFVGKIFRQIEAGARELHVVDDKLGTPTYTVDFTRGIERLVESELYGLYNQVCHGAGSRYDVALELMRLWGLESSVPVVRVDSSHFSEEYFAPRPRSEKLVNVKLRARGLDIMRDWRECLREYAAQFESRLRPR